MRIIDPLTSENQVMQPESGTPRRRGRTTPEPARASMIATYNTTGTITTPINPLYHRNNAFEEQISGLKSIVIY